LLTTHNTKKCVYLKDNRNEIKDVKE